ncbi:ATP-dependent nuclease [Paraburkholderia bannensis]|uniref:ATP-dependent nuclease n=1 Tax=Paraburkholderia bannensis TaxID=765414 RepID=UPI002ABE5264|nr:AAA family ATPase [Paraburkholderia bannensis]
MAGKENRSKLVRISVRNIGCIGNDAVEVSLDDIVCLVGRNNAGKSTILRSYELAKGSLQFDTNRDRHIHANDDSPSEVVLEVHIPDGIGNIAPEWKVDDGGLRIVKSRWQWAAPHYQKVRTTWNPAGGVDGKGDWDPDKNAAGLDNVFTSRLPRPLRIGSLDDAEKTEEMLLTLALTPLLTSLEKERLNKESALAKAIASITANIDALSTAHAKGFNEIADQVTEGFKSVFPALGVRLNIASAPFSVKLEDLLKRGSGLRIADGKADTSLSQQGTGARRALFWAMLQVHNELTRDAEIRAEFRKRLEKDIVDEGKKKAKKQPPEVVAEIDARVEKLSAQLEAHLAGAPIPESPDDPSLPGYLLLIDEPENALHPMAARAAQRHLYRLAESPDWQVLMTTHSPYFVNPFEDHTTIVRLERTSDGADAPIAPMTYRSDSITFEGDEKQRLQALQNIDPSFAEVFFGSYPILVEGDTEHAAFIAAIVEKQQELMDRATVIRARGKAILVPLVKVLRHFKIDFGVVHDCDPPFKSNGDKNGMWTENKKIRDAILEARAAGLTVRHRVSIPDFERFLGGDEASKDKPLNAYRAISESAEVSQFVQSLLNELVHGEQCEPFPATEIGEDYVDALHTKVLAWAKENGVENTPRYAGAAKI